jgi:6-phosphogluconate dehydrogenase
VAWWLYHPKVRIIYHLYNESIDVFFSVFLGNIKSAYDKKESLENLLLDEFFTDAINKCQVGWRKVIATATVYGIPIPCLSTGKI